MTVDSINKRGRGEFLRFLTSFGMTEQIEMTGFLRMTVRKTERRLYDLEKKCLLCYHNGYFLHIGNIFGNCAGRHKTEE